VTGLIGAAADLGSTLLSAIIRALLEVLATVFIIAMALYVTAVGLRHRKRRYPAAEDSAAMLSRWMDEPEVIPDALSRDLARLLAEGDGRG
jgi:sulfite exporter TauE/SafE